MQGLNFLLCDKESQGKGEKLSLNYKQHFMPSAKLHIILMILIL